MRVSTAQFNQQSIDSIGRRNEAIARLQEQLSSGRRINQSSDDPIAAAEAERIRSSTAQLAIEKRMMSFATGMLTQAESTLANGSDVVQSARELLIAAGNGSLQAEDRALIATQLQGLRAELLTVANQRDGAGGYVFGGQGAGSPPFTPDGAPAYRPKTGTQQTGLDVSFDTTVDGGHVFIGDGGATTGSIFAALDTIIAQLDDATLDGVALRTGLDIAIQSTDASLGRMLTARTEIGEQLRALDSRGRLVESGELRAASRLSDLTATDYAAAISELQTHQLAVDAAMRTYAQIARLSLFDYL